MTETPEAFGSATPAGKPPRGNADDRADVPRDSKDRYVMPGENGEPPAFFKNGNPIGITRASTIKNIATDKTGINIWKGELTLRGLAADPGLNAEMMKAVAADDKQWIRKVANKAFIAGGGKVAADRGTAFHEVTENIKKGVQVDPGQIGDQLVARDVTAYLQLLDEAMIRPVPGMQEKTVLMMLAGEKVAGTFDDMFEWWNPDTEAWELVLGDTKTGKDILTWGALEIIVQMAQYVRARKILRLPKDGGPAPWGDYTEMPPVSQNHVIIMHTPQNGTAKAYLVDIAGAQEVLDAVMVLRRWGSDSKHRFREIGSVDLREAAYVAPATGGVVLPPGDITAATLQSMTPDGQPSMTQVEHLPQRTPGAALAADEWGQAQGFQPTGLINSPGITVSSSAGIHAFQPTPTTPTPDAAEQERKRLDRMAVLDKVATGLGRNDDRDDAGEQGPEPIIANGSGGILLDGEGKPLAPLKQDGQRGCGVCGRVGHKAKSKRCLGDRDPAKQTLPPLPESAYGPYDVALPEPEPVGPYAPTPDNQRLPAGSALGTEPITEAEWMPTSAELDQVKVDGLIEFEHPTFQPGPVTDTQYCPGVSPGHSPTWTTRPDMPGLSVCSIDGLPTKAHAEAMAASRAARAATPGLMINGQPATSWSPIQPGPLGAVQMIAECKTVADVVALVQTLQAKGVWSDEINQAATERYNQVQHAGTPWATS